jgi:hypothetical protein
MLIRLNHKTGIKTTKKLTLTLNNLPEKHALLIKILTYKLI